MIEVEHIVKDYGTRRAVDDISFSMQKGKIYGFLGPNGAGKSTTMNIMTGYLAATSGVVRINGHDILGEPMIAKKDIGFLPEIPPVLLDFTVTEYLRYAARLKNIPIRCTRDAQAKVLQMTGLGAVRTRLIKNLSKGYKQRVGLAAALIGLPEIIILDEPTVGLDPAQIIEIRNLISSLRDEHTVVLSSHILSEVSSVCDELIIISHGKIAAEGTQAELEEKYCANNGLVLRAMSKLDKVMTVLKRISGVKRIDILDAEEPVSFLIQANNQNEIQEMTARALFEEGIPVYEMYHRQQSLEEVFLNATNSTQSFFDLQRAKTPFVKIAAEDSFSAGEEN